MRSATAAQPGDIVRFKVDRCEYKFCIENTAILAKQLRRVCDQILASTEQQDIRLCLQQCSNALSQKVVTVAQSIFSKHGLRLFVSLPPKGY